MLWTSFNAELFINYFLSPVSVFKHVINKKEERGKKKKQQLQQLVLSA